MSRLEILYRAHHAADNSDGLIFWVDYMTPDDELIYETLAPFRRAGWRLDVIPGSRMTKVRFNGRDA